ncbi:N-6 DNA methylase [Limosilactobacillus mucosae]
MIALLAEGSTEEAILNVLLDHDALKFNRTDLLQEEVLRVRAGRLFAKRYLNKGLQSKIDIYRVLDSRAENFKLPKPYEKKVSSITDIYTRPEIEILYILYHNDYSKFANQTDKPSTFAKKNYHDIQNLKAYDDNYDFWNLHFDRLIDVLEQYRKQKNRSEHAIYDLLK